MIRLEKFDHSAYEKLISWIDTPEALMQFAGPAFTFPLTADQLDKSLSDGKRFAYKVVDASSDATIGHAEINITEKSAYLGRILIGDRQLRGKGIGQAVVSLLLDIAFRKLNQSTVELNVFEWNEMAIRCYEKVGFALNPEKRSERIVNGQNWIALNMTINKQKWEQLPPLLFRQR